MISITISLSPSQMPPSLPPIDFDSSSHDLCYTVCQTKYGVSFHFSKGFAYQGARALDVSGKILALTALAAWSQ
jgi:hypothetical protein